MIEEIWKDITEFQGLYQISNFGNVKSLAKITYNPANGYKNRKEKLLIPQDSSRPYLFVTLSNNKYKKMIRVHRLVATYFIPNPENKPYINHKNGVVTDNRVENLEWVTASENTRHAMALDLINKPNSKINKEIADKIRKDYITNTISQRKLAKIYNVSQLTICNVVNNKVWI